MFRRARVRDGGLTLLELMVTLAIVAILASIALPSFLSLIQSNRVAGEINALSGDLQFARAEAVKRGQPVTVCVSANGAACISSTPWNSGWIVFADADGDKTVDSGDTVLKIQKPWTSSDSFAAGGSVSAITYSRDGFAIGLAATVTLKLTTTPANDSATRCLTVNLAGRQTVQSLGTGTCT